MSKPERTGLKECGRVLALVVALVLTTSADAGRPPEVYGLPRPYEVAPTDTSVKTRRALIVFVRFKDDTTEMSGCTEKAAQWRRPDDLPAFSKHLLAAEPNPPFDSRSLTDYFYQQSNGQFIFFGEVFPEVVTTPGRQAEYGPDGVNPHFLTPDILEIVNRDDRIDLSEFDYNDDGILDYVLFVLRSRERWVPSIANASGIGYLGYHSSKAEFGNKSPLKMARNQLGGYVNYDTPGNIFPDLNLVRLMAHEIGHSLWGWGHPKPIGGTNGVPSNDSKAIGYLLMAGVGNRAGSLTISAAERDMLGKGWIKCSTLRRDTTVGVNDLYTSSSENCYKIGTTDASGLPAELYVENRQRISNFEQLRSESCYGSRSDHGLMSTGLLVTKVQKGRVALLAADNSLDISVRHEDYAGDMFEPWTNAQVTPWSSPNIRGWSAYPRGFQLGPGDLKAIDDIRYDPDEPSRMLFDFLTDFRNQPVIRSDSRIGPESGSTKIIGPARIQSGVKLRIATDVTVDGRLTVDAGSVLHVEAGAFLTVDTLRLERGSFARVDGLLTVRDTLINGDADLDVDLFDGGLVTPAHLPTEFDIDACSLQACAIDLEVYPNPVRELLSIAISVPTHVSMSLEVYDSLGRIVEQPLRNTPMSSGRHKIRWRPNVASGTYVVKATAGRTSKAIAVAVVR